VNSLDLFEHHIIKPFAFMGLTHSFWDINLDTIIFTWLALLIIAMLALAGRTMLKYPETIPGYLSLSYARTISSMITQSTEKYRYRYVAFIGSLFTYIFICNLIVILPFVEEPTKDLNTTLALALISFTYVQREAIRAHGIWGYIKEFFKPFAVFFPLEVLGKLATIVSLSFRLFGNIFGGSIVGTMWAQALSGSIIAQTLGILLGINFIIMIFFGLFEGLIQAFVFSILTLTYLSMATREEEHE